jgi:ATP-dependent DNA helicase RecQ
MHTIFTIGYGSLAIEDFLGLLNKNGVKALVDIRSKPYSKARPEYCKKELERAVMGEGIEYIFLGHKLGGMPDDDSFYNSEGNVDYELLQESPVYRQGIMELISLAEKSDICIMCAEALPERCHRGFLVSESLYSSEVETRHILHDGKLVDHGRIRVKFDSGQTDLFQ